MRTSIKALLAALALSAWTAQAPALAADDAKSAQRQDQTQARPGAATDASDRAMGGTDRQKHRARAKGHEHMGPMAGAGHEARQSAMDRCRDMDPTERRACQREAMRQAADSRGPTDLALSDKDEMRQRCESLTGDNQEACRLAYKHRYAS